MKTLRKVRDALKVRGITITFDPDADEYRVNFKAGREATAYYTNDLDDALGTGHAMADTLAPMKAPPTLAPTVVDVGTIIEYGLVQKLTTPVRCF